MQTLSFQQNNRAPAERLIFQYHSNERPADNVDHRNICAAVRAWAAVEGRLVVALQIKKAAQDMGVGEIDMSGSADTWNVKLFRWLDNKHGYISYQKNIQLLTPVIVDVLPLQYRSRLLPMECSAARLATKLKEDSEAARAVALNAPQHERSKEIQESIHATAWVDGPNSVISNLVGAIVMSGMDVVEGVKAALLEQERLSGANTVGNCGEQYVKHR
ncbi:TPA: hypothetical protein JV334_002524 [Escherichia coli]|uniref:toxin YdaT family protein n=1 Tax=Escherichia coli TaxID=562 RepID=UPI001BCE87FB|nr:toxin YdaT family protein [Escherichia coli]MBS4226661.1 hypothetical protein [Escherichia coli]MDO2021937.1 toxin YdaT family protein [Escherichia coli]HAX3614095.1 hypothetical protein [Escherichia coli]HBB3827649.1 hypothetical protein [Escherichia coli]HCK0676870.1 hypothetical protein [Escherichia coli]